MAKMSFTFTLSGLAGYYPSSFFPTFLSVVCSLRVMLIGPLATIVTFARAVMLLFLQAFQELVSRSTFSSTCILMHYQSGP